MPVDVADELANFVESVSKGFAGVEGKKITEVLLIDVADELADFVKLVPGSFSGVE